MDYATKNIGLVEGPLLLPTLAVAGGLAYYFYFKPKTQSKADDLLAELGCVGCGFVPSVHSYGETAESTEVEVTEPPEKPVKQGSIWPLLAVFGGMGAMLLALPVASSFVFGRKYGGPGYVVGFFVPMALSAGVGAIKRLGKEK